MMISAGQDLRAYKLDGLEVQNECVWDRGIHFHESYLTEGPSGGMVQKVQTHRIEDVDQSDPHKLDFDRVVLGEHMVVADTPGCVTTSQEDFTFIKKSGIVPPPTPPATGRWGTKTPPAAQEGILFVAWFWGDKDAQAITPRDYTHPRACLDRRDVRQSKAKASADQYIQALRHPVPQGPPLRSDDEIGNWLNRN
jgi:hypothetical protein